MLLKEQPCINFIYEFDVPSPRLPSLKLPHLFMTLSSLCIYPQASPRKKINPFFLYIYIINPFHNPIAFHKINLFLSKEKAHSCFC